MKKKISNLINIIAVYSILFTVATVGAAYLVQYTAHTYVNSTHPDIWTYNGRVSVRGADWIQIKQSAYYPEYSKITYDVPGKPLQSEIVKSDGKSDIFTKKRYITVKDTLNPVAPKTKVKWDVGLKYRGNEAEPYSLENNK